MVSQRTGQKAQCVELRHAGEAGEVEKHVLTMLDGFGFEDADRENAGQFSGCLFEIGRAYAPCFVRRAEQVGLPGRKAAVSGDAAINQRLDRLEAGAGQHHCRPQFVLVARVVAG